MDPYGCVTELFLPLSSIPYPWDTKRLTAAAPRGNAQRGIFSSLRDPVMSYKEGTEPRDRVMRLEAREPLDLLGFRFM